MCLWMAPSTRLFVRFESCRLPATCSTVCPLMSVPSAITAMSDKQTKRSDYISWPDYFMSVAYLSAMRSKDPNTQVGACIVNSENKIVGIGYNGMPTGCSDDELPWGRTADNPLDNKYLYVCHAEMNAILNKNSVDVRRCTLYVTKFPCNECAKLIIQSGIARIFYVSAQHADKPEYEASRRLLEMAGVEVRPFQLGQRQIVINLDQAEAQS